MSYSNRFSVLLESAREQVLQGKAEIEQIHRSSIGYGSPTHTQTVARSTQILEHHFILCLTTRCSKATRIRTRAA
jgi:hypothetical protein